MSQVYQTLEQLHDKELAQEMAKDLFRYIEDASMESEEQELMHYKLSLCVPEYMAVNGITLPRPGIYVNESVLT